jgi:hypothetical protein
MSDVKYKNTRVGTVLRSKKNEGSSYIALGSKHNKDPKYDTTVEIIVRDSEGKVIAKQVDGFLNVADPREFSKGKIPDAVLFQISMSEKL